MSVVEGFEIMKSFLAQPHPKMPKDVVVEIWEEELNVSSSQETCPRNFLHSFYRTGKVARIFAMPAKQNVTFPTISLYAPELRK
ncbi:hypothetical protein A3Q56_08033 [Intoshia linei]|uniref:Uncharacterized protein n=1 Tax=Intoshia linei TaxID=1819745 RepID=A0A177ASB1_9BILA|nr:hypothetical protein A3Q56_08033 [Intoshia linei]